MGGRAHGASDVSEITIAFGMPPERPTPHVAANWNMTPTDPLPIVRYDAFLIVRQRLVSPREREHGV